MSGGTAGWAGRAGKPLLGARGRADPTTIYRWCVRPKINKLWLLAEYRFLMFRWGNSACRSPMEHRGVQYEIKVGIEKSHWVWIVHISPTPRQGSVEGTRQAAI